MALGNSNYPMSLKSYSLIYLSKNDLRKVIFKFFYREKLFLKNGVFSVAINLGLILKMKRIQCMFMYQI